MPRIDKLFLTDKQTIAIGEIVSDCIGANIQTGVTEDNLPYIMWQMGPNLPVKKATIKKDGTVFFFHPTSVG